jgi:hypothetical protein
VQLRVLLMHLSIFPARIFRVGLVLWVIIGLVLPLQTLAQDAAPAAEAQEAPAPGVLQISLSGSNDVPLSGSFAVSDSAGAYHQVAVSGGFGAVGNVSAGPATVTQLSGTTDFALDYTARYVEVPAGGTASAAFINAFLDADGDGIGDSVDACPAGNDLVDSDLDGIADACDPTPFGDPTPIPTAIPTVEPTIVPTEMPTQAPTMEPTIEPTETTQVVAEDETAELLVEIADEPMIVEDAPVSCAEAAATSPWIVSDLDDYPPGGLVTLTGGDWVPGQIVELLVEDDGIADAEQGEWQHVSTVTADDAGSFTYAFNIAPWFVADYTVVATGECAKAETAFTDSVQGGGCEQVSASDMVLPGQYITFRCQSAGNPIRIGVTSTTTGWEWAYQFSNDAIAPLPSNWSTSTLGDSSASGNIAQAYFFIRPTTTIHPGGQGSFTIQIKNPSGNAVEYTSTLIGYRAIAASDFKMSCSPGSLTVGVTSSDMVTCTLSAVQIASGASVTATIPAPTAPAGWMLIPTTALTGQVTQATSHRVTFSLTPTCTSSAEARAISVTSSLVLVGSSPPPTISGPTANFNVARSMASTFATQVTSADLEWSREYSLTTSPINPGSLTYTLDAVGCAGWNVQVLASPFVSATGRSIPAENLTLTGSTTPSGTGLSRPATSGPLNVSTTVLNASSTNGIGTYAQTLSLNMNIPAGILVGTYQSTVTITASSGP